MKKIGTKNGTVGALLRGVDIEILLCIGTGTNANNLLHRRLKKKGGKRVPNSTISRHTTKIQKLKLITSQKLFNVKEFKLTDQGKVAVSNFLTRGEAQRV